MIEQSLAIDGLQKVAFKEAKIVEGDDKSPFYLSVTYTFENLYGVYELHIPKINMGEFFSDSMIPNIVHEIEEDLDLLFRGRYPRNLLKSRSSSPNFIFPLISGGGLILEDPKDQNLDGRGFEIKTIKEKEREMTLEEIEKKLGHKVKIVAK